MTAFDPFLGSPQFRTTRWTLILNTQVPSEHSKKALSEFFEIYWFPLYAFARRRGLSPDDAQDRVQDLFSQILENQDWIAAADPNKGRFRSFLLTIFQRSLAKEYRRQNSLKRGGSVKTLTLDYECAENRYQLDPCHNETPEKLFDRRWAMSVLNRVLDQLYERYERDGKSIVFESFKGFLTGDTDHGSQKEIGANIGLSATASKVAVHRLRQRYGKILRDEILDTLENPDEFEDELQELLRALEN